ncbi:MAG: GtrA family protein, partial [Clostridia bacterium]|nr:GtrA family protein [Clostridia bacterium]
MIGELFKKYREQIMYVFFGGFTTLVNWGVYALFADFVLGEGDMNKSISKTIAWGAAVIFAFITNKFFVFEHKS